MAIARKAVGEVLVIRTDGIVERLEGEGALPMFEGERMMTAGDSLALLVLANGIQIVMNERTEFLLLSRWERDKGFTPILRLRQGELWVKTLGGSKSLEVETPVATASVNGTEFSIHVGPEGQSTLTVIEGKVEFGNALNTWIVPGGTRSEGNRGEKCTKPQAVIGNLTLAWTKAIGS
jgi:hypothetical protein